MWTRVREYANAKTWMELTRKLALPGFVLVSSIAASYFVASRWLVSAPLPAHVVSETSGAAATLTNPFGHANGMNLIAYVIVSSDCGWSTMPTVKTALGSIREELEAVHGSSYAHISVIGVALDRDLEAGLRFLSDLGNGETASVFDQIIVGGSWLNEQVIRLVWRQGIAEAASPQVMVIERLVDTDTYPLTSSIQLQSDRPLASLVGSTEIIQWIDDGLPLN